MLDPVQGDVALLRGNVVVADGPQLAVGAHQELDAVHGVREAHVLEREHVGHRPEILQRLRLARRTLGLRNRKVKLRRDGNNTRFNSIPQSNPVYSSPAAQRSRLPGV